MISWYSASRSMFPSANPEVLLGVLQPLDKCVYFARGRVEVRRHSRRALHPEPLVRGLGAVVPGAHREAAAVEHLRDVVGVDAVDLEGDRTTAGGGVTGAKDRQTGHGR